MAFCPTKAQLTQYIEPSTDFHHVIYTNLTSSSLVKLCKTSLRSRPTQVCRFWIQKWWGFKSEYFGIVGLWENKSGQIDVQLGNSDVIGAFFPNRRRLVIKICRMFPPLQERTNPSSCLYHVPNKSNGLRNPGHFPEIFWKQKPIKNNYDSPLFTIDIQFGGMGMSPFQVMLAATHLTRRLSIARKVGLGYQEDSQLVFYSKNEMITQCFWPSF